MKPILILFLSLFMIFNHAQEVSDYKYISISSEFQGFEKGQYQLDNYLRLLLSQKDFEILSENRNYWPQEAQLNPCLVLRADAEKIKAAFKNKILLKFMDCNQQIIHQFEGESNIKEFAQGYKEALRLAVAQVKNQNTGNITYRDDDTKKVNLNIKTESEHPGTALFKKYSNQSQRDATNIGDVFLLEGKAYFKSDLDNGEFLILNPDKKTVSAHFYPGSKQGIYHVFTERAKDKITFGIGYYDGQHLSYEYLNEDQKMIQVEFKKNE